MQRGKKDWYWDTRRREKQEQWWIKNRGPGKSLLKSNKGREGGPIRMRDGVSNRKGRKSANQGLRVGFVVLKWGKFEGKGNVV